MTFLKFYSILFIDKKSNILDCGKNYNLLKLKKSNILGFLQLKEIDELPKNYSEQLYKVIGKNVKKIRQSKNISQLQLAYAIGYKSVSPISSAEIYYNKIHFNIEHLTKIAYVLEVDICELFVDTNLIT